MRYFVEVLYFLFALQGYFCSVVLAIVVLSRSLWKLSRPRGESPGVIPFLAMNLSISLVLWMLKLFTTEVLEGEPGPNVGEGEIGNRILGIIWRWSPSLENFERHDHFHSHDYLVRLTPGTPPCSADVNEDRYQWLVGSAYLYSTVLTVGLLALWIWNRRRLKPDRATVFD